SALSRAVAVAGARATQLAARPGPRREHRPPGQARGAAGAIAGGRAADRAGLGGRALPGTTRRIDALRPAANPRRAAKAPARGASAFSRDHRRNSLAVDRGLNG